MVGSFFGTPFGGAGPAPTFGEPGLQERDHEARGLAGIVTA